MAKYDPVTKILSSTRLPQVFGPNVSAGQVILTKFFKNPNKAIQMNIDDGIELTCSQVATMMTNITKNLYKIGLRSGDVCGLAASNTTYLAPTIYGCLLLRLPINPVELSFNINKIKNIFRKTKPKVIFCDHDVVDKMRAVSSILRIEAIIITLTERIEGFMHISDLLQENNGFDEFIYNVDLSVADALILCTSGTSGYPKLTLISHLQQLNIYASIRSSNMDGLFYNPTNIHWLPGICMLIFQTLNLQKRLVTNQIFTPDLFFDLVEKYSISDMYLVPPFLAMLVKSPRFETTDLSSIKSIYTSGMIVDVEMRRKFKEKLTNGYLSVVYGATETCMLISETTSDMPISTSVGIPTVNTEVKIQLDDGTTGWIKEKGEILFRNVVPLTGYLGNQPKIKIDDDGWFHTGDMGFIDENYEINIIGQRTFVIRNNYNEIHPYEIENKIYSLGGIKRVCVVGVPDPVEIEIPAALIVLEKNSSIDESLVLEVTNDLPLCKQLRGGIYFVENLPLSSTGKIQRYEAKEMAMRLRMERESRMAG